MLTIRERSGFARIRAVYKDCVLKPIQTILHTCYAQVMTYHASVNNIA